MGFSNKLCLAAPMDVVLENKEIKHMKLLQWDKQSSEPAFAHEQKIPPPQISSLESEAELRTI